MAKLYSDILHYIFQKLNNDGSSLLSCLLVNKQCIILKEELNNKKLSFNYVRFCKHICVHNFLLNQDIYGGEVRHPIYQFPGAEICLLNLNEVDCKSCLETSLFYGIAHICKLIEKIYMEFKYDNIGLAKLIITQKRIKYKGRRDYK
ncbi:unnamed protein product [Rhizophagus irregularis]|nr:unnamed protein product [Rhizophagus irregularis]